MNSRDSLVTGPRLQAASEWCLKLAKGSLSPREREQFDGWIKADAENHRALEDAVGIWRAVGDTAASPDLLPLRREALASFEEAGRAQWRLKPRRATVAALAAAVVFLAAGGAWVWFASGHSNYRTGIGERHVVVLSDGSKMSLDSLTQVDVRYSDQARTLRLLKGRAKFEVAKDRTRPFTVAAGDKLVRAIGTAFSVELLQRQVQVILYEGHVDVLNAADGAHAEPIKLRRAAASKTPPVDADEVLTPGDELLVPVAAPTAVAEVQAADPVRSLAWEGGQLVFVAEPLVSAVERVNRYSERKLKIGDPSAAAVRIDGVFAAGDTDAFVEGVTGVFPLVARDTPDGQVLVKKH